MRYQDVVVGTEYNYLDQWVKVLEVYGTNNEAEAVIETRFGSRTTIPITELEEKH